MPMPRKKNNTNRSSLKLIKCEPSLPKIEPEVDEVALLIKSINESSRQVKAKGSQPPEPPKAA